MELAASGLRCDASAQASTAKWKSSRGVPRSGGRGKGNNLGTPATRHLEGDSRLASLACTRGKSQNTLRQCILKNSQGMNRPGAIEVPRAECFLTSRK